MPKPLKVGVAMPDAWFLREPLRSCSWLILMEFSCSTDNRIFHCRTGKRCVVACLRIPALTSGGHIRALCIAFLN